MKLTRLDIFNKVFSSEFTVYLGGFCRNFSTDNILFTKPSNHESKYLSSLYSSFENS